MRNKIQKHESDLCKLKQELENKKKAQETMNNNVTNRIEADLFESNREDYLLHGSKNWSLLRKHVYLVEQYCKKYFRGKIPGKQDIAQVLEKALSEDRPDTFFSRSKQNKKREDNPTKHSLEKYGIEFPKGDCDDNCNSILYTAPKNEREEAEQLAIVMRESVRNSGVPFQIFDNRSFPPAFLPPMPMPLNGMMMNRMPYAPFNYESQERAYPSTCTSTNSMAENIDENNEGLLAPGTAEPTVTETANALLSLSQGSKQNDTNIM